MEKFILSIGLGAGMFGSPSAWESPPIQTGPGRFSAGGALLEWVTVKNYIQNEWLCRIMQLKTRQLFYIYCHVWQIPKINSHGRNHMEPPCSLLIKLWAGKMPLCVWLISATSLNPCREVDSNEAVITALVEFNKQFLIKSICNVQRHISNVWLPSWPSNQHLNISN